MGLIFRGEFLSPGINVKIKSLNSRKIQVYSGNNRENESGNSREIRVYSGNNRKNEIQEKTQNLR